MDPFKSWYLETLAIAEMENRRASPGPSLGEGLNYFLASFVLCYLEHNCTISIFQNEKRFLGIAAWGVRVLLEPSGTHRSCETCGGALRGVLGAVVGP